MGIYISSANCGGLVLGGGFNYFTNWSNSDHEMFQSVTIRSQIYLGAFIFGFS